MKYTKANPPLVCMQTNSTCYKQTYKMPMVGILWHSTGANNPKLSRYVQPADNDPNRDSLLQLIGKNNYNTDYNHSEQNSGLNAFIGKLADGSVSTIQTMPWDFRPWGCGKGSKGSCNNGWIQFEICEDDLKDLDYARAVYKEACELSAYLCALLGVDPKGYATLQGVAIPTITCHADAHALGFGSNHGDINHWFPKALGKDMASVRADVAALLESAAPPASEDEEDNVMRYNSIESIPLYAQPTVIKLIDKGLLGGVGAGAVDKNGRPADLNLSEDMLRVFVVNDRAGVYGE